MRVIKFAGVYSYLVSSVGPPITPLQRLKGAALQQIEEVLNSLQAFP